MRIRRRRNQFAVALAVALAAAAVPLAPSPARAAAGPCGTASGAAPATFDHVVLLIFENKPRSFVIGDTKDAPYLNSLADECGQATQMLALSNTSLANYIALTSGYTGHPVTITQNSAPKDYPQDTVSLFEQLGVNGWKEESESLPGNCYDARATNFAVNHTPAPYYTRIHSQCQADDVPMPATPDLSAPFTLLTPNKTDIMHSDGTASSKTQQQRLANGDRWASNYLPKVLASPQYQAGRTAVIITWDEGNNKTFNVPFIVVSPYTTPGYTTSARLDHYSTLKGTEQLLGITTYLGHAGDPGTVSVADYFGLS